MVYPYVHMNIIIIIIILYINMRIYITNSARVHELSGRVRAHAYNNYYTWAEMRVGSK